MEEIERAIVSRMLQKYGSLQNAFLELDENRTGRITASQFASALGSLGLDVSLETVNEIIKKYDIKNEGAFDYEAFAKFYDGPLTRHLTSDYIYKHRPKGLGLKVSVGPAHAERSLEEKEKDLRALIRDKLYEHSYSSNRSNHFTKLFLKFDQDRKGVLTYDEVHYGLERLLGVKLTSEQLCRLLYHIDPQFTQQVSLYDFLSLLQQTMREGEQKTYFRSEEKSRTIQRRTTEYVEKTPLPVVKKKSKVRISVSDSDFNAIHKIVDQLEEQRLHLKDVFESMDKDGTHVVNCDQLKEGLAAMGIESSDAKLQALMDHFGHNGHMKYHEFVRMISATSAELHDDFQQAEEKLSQASSSPSTASEPAEAREFRTKPIPALVAEISATIYARYRSLKAAFADIDKHGTKEISKREFKEALKRLSIEVSDADVDEIFSQFNVSGSDGLRYYEFIRLLAATKHE